MPPLGSAPLGASAGPSGALVLGEPTAAQVKESGIPCYICKADDTTFTTISLKVYGSEKYGRALAQFNAELPEKPVPLPGRKVSTPATEFLEQNFASLIGDKLPPLGSRSAAASPNQAPVAYPSRTNDKPATTDYYPPLGATPRQIPVEDLSRSSSPPPPPLGQQDVRPPQVQSNSAPTNDDGAKTYRVGDQGEGILDIARTTLGQSSRWPEIYRLNGNINPAYPIPGGTVLNMPNSAVVPRDAEPTWRAEPRKGPEYPEPFQSPCGQNKRPIWLPARGRQPSIRRVFQLPEVHRLERVNAEN